MAAPCARESISLLSLKHTPSISGFDHSYLCSYLHCCQDIVLSKGNLESWGFSIVGGFEESKGNQPFFIKTIVPGTPAFRDRRLKYVWAILWVSGV